MVITNSSLAAVIFILSGAVFMPETAHSGWQVFYTCKAQKMFGSHGRGNFATRSQCEAYISSSSGFERMNSCCSGFDNQQSKPSMQKQPGGSHAASQEKEKEQKLLEQKKQAEANQELMQQKKFENDKKQLLEQLKGAGGGSSLNLKSGSSQAPVLKSTQGETKASSTEWTAEQCKIAQNRVAACHNALKQAAEVAGRLNRAIAADQKIEDDNEKLLRYKSLFCFSSNYVDSSNYIIFGQVIPEEARRFMTRGIAAVEMAKSVGDYNLAALEFEQAVKLAPEWPDPYYNLGNVQSKVGDYTSAIKSFQRYLDLAPKSPDAEKVREEIFKLEYRHDGQKLATTLSGAWTTSKGQKFTLLLDGSRLQIRRDEQQSDDILTIKSMGTHIGPMTDEPPIVFFGTLVGDKISGQYLHAAGKSSGHCDIPEHKGLFEGTVDVATGQIRLIYNRVVFEYEMKFKSLFSAELICWRTNQKKTPDFILELKRNPQSPAQNNK